MRELITGLAIILIAVLTTALVGPYFVDWNSQRPLLETQLTRALGQKVTIGGNIDLRLLPTPYLVLSQTVIGGDDGPVTIGIRHLDLQLSVTPLLHGELDIVEALLEEPNIRVTLGQDRTLPALPDAPAFKADVRFDRLHVTGGTLAVADPQSGRTFVLDKLKLDAESPSLAGPFKGNGSYGEGDALTKFRFSTTTFQKDRSRVRLLVDENLQHAGLDLDGDLTLKRAQKSIVHESFDGTLTALGHVWSESGTPTAWRLSGPLKADPAKAQLDGGELRLGTEEAGLSLKADIGGIFGESPKLTAAFAAKQLDIDRLSGAPIDAAKPPPPQLPTLDNLRHLLAAVTPPLPTTVDLSVETATYAGATFSDIAAHLGFGAKAPEKLKIAGDGPGGAHVDFDGTLAPDPVHPFAGTLDVKADDLPQTLDWLATVDPGLGLKSGSIPAKAVRLAGRVTAGQQAIDVADLKLDVDRSHLIGKASLSLGSGSQPAKITAALAAKTLQLATLPRLDGLAGSAFPADLEVTLNADRVAVADVGDGLETGKLALAFAKAGGAFAVKSLSVRDFGGADVTASGRIDGAGAKLAMTVAAKKLDRAADLLRQLAPAEVAAALPKDVAALAPTNAKIDATFTTAKTQRLAASRVLVAGQFADTKVDVSLVPDDSAPGTVSLEATAESPQGSRLLHQLGYGSLPLDTIGKSRILLSAHGELGQPLDGTLQASLGGTRMDVQGRFALRDLAAPGASGSFKVRSGDVSPILRTLGMANPDLGETLPLTLNGSLDLSSKGATLAGLNGRLADSNVTGSLRWADEGTDKPALTGSLDFDRIAVSGLLALALGPTQPPPGNAQWSDAPFAPGFTNPPRTSIALKSRSIQIWDNVVGTDVALDLGLAPNVVTIKGLKAVVGGGTMASDLTLRRDGPLSTLEGTLQADKVRVDLPALKTTLSGRVELAGSGKSEAALVASLAGSGETTLAEIVIPGADPNALPKIFADVEDDSLAVDDDSILRALDKVAADPLRAGTRRFGVGVAGGTLTLDPKDAAPVADGKIESTMRAELDLRRLRLAERVEQTLRALPKNWTGPPPAVGVTLSGPFATPRRFWDVSAFINAVAARAIARETARIEALEFDVRERAIFNQRLQSERRREQDRRKAEADAQAAAESAKRAADLARKAEAERRKAEAARREQERQDAERAQRERGPEPPPAPSPQPDQGQRFDAPSAGTNADPSAAGRY